LLPVIVYTAAPDGAIDFVNRRWTELTGRDASALVGDGWRSLVHPDDLQAVADATGRAVASGQRLTFECRFRRPDGTYAWITSRAVPAHADDGRVRRWYGAAVDIDARRRAEDALRASRAELVDSERRFRVLAEAIPVMCFTADANGWIDWYNQRWYEFTGQSPDEALGWGWQAAHHPEDFLEVMQRWPHSLGTGEPFEMEFRLRRRDGRFHWFLSRIEPLRDAAGRIVRWYGSNVDIDAQKRALERTKRVAETLQDVFLPSKLPQLAGVRFDAVYLPAERDALIGGDWYDAFELPDGRLIFSIGDVAGHGLAASLSVGRLRQAIYALAFTLHDPATILAQLNAMLEHQEPGTMVTAMVGAIDPDHARLTYASAGHPPPIVAYPGDETARSLPLGGPPLGTGLAARWTSHRARLAPDAVLAVFTDGMIEFSRDVADAEARLRAAVKLLVGDTTIARPAAAVQQLVFDTRRPHDDAALLIVQFSDVDAGALDYDAAALTHTWRFHSSDAYTAHTSRREIVRFIRSLAIEHDQLFACELILGEILANTVEHAPGLVEVRLDWTREKPVAIVRDTGPGLEQFVGRLPDDVLSEDGRGIYLVNALADEVTVRQAAGYGTEIRVVLPIAGKRALRALDGRG
jgi:PAS domain S-box-containing protein